jgi:hypothetical protein
MKREIIYKTAKICDNNIIIKLEYNDKNFKYRYGEHPYIEYFNEIKLENYVTKYNIINQNYESKQISLFIKHNIFGITTLKY